MVSGLHSQTCLTKARTAHAQGQPAVPPLLPRRPPPRFRLQSSDTSSLAARPGGRVGGGARPRGGADTLFPAPASPGNAFCGVPLVTWLGCQRGARGVAWGERSTLSFGLQNGVPGLGVPLPWALWCRNSGDSNSKRERN